MCHMPNPEITSTKESTPKPKRARLSFENPKKTEISPSATLYRMVIHARAFAYA